MGEDSTELEACKVLLPLLRWGLAVASLSWQSQQAMQAQIGRLQIMRKQVEAEEQEVKTQIQAMKEEVQETKAQRNRLILLEAQVKEALYDLQVQRRYMNKM